MNAGAGGGEVPGAGRALFADELASLRFGDDDIAFLACFGLQVAGTQAHSWVMAFPSELDAFRA